MTLKMVINAADTEEVRIAILNDGLLEEFAIETESIGKNKGNIYKGIVTAVEPSLNAAFVHYGAEKQGFLAANEVNPKLALGADKIQLVGSKGREKDPKDKSKGKAPKDTPKNIDLGKITNLLRPKQEILVQVVKDEVSTKGAVLTTYLSLAGRYLVLMPDSETQGVSRKIVDEELRAKMREAASKLAVPKQMGVIIRTAGSDRTKSDLNRDLKFLLNLWKNISEAAKQEAAPALIFKEQDVLIRALRDHFSNAIEEIILDSKEAYQQASGYMRMVMPENRKLLTLYSEARPIFHYYQIEPQLDTIYGAKVLLPSGGSLIIEPTEALVAIDVNSGKQKSANQEELALQTNIEAARESARQLKLRDLGGIIIIDFIDMISKRHRAKVEKVLSEALKNDKAKINMGHISSNGTLELTRQRLNKAVWAIMSDMCPVCRGSGHVLNPASEVVAILRKIQDKLATHEVARVNLAVNKEVMHYLQIHKQKVLKDIKKDYDVEIDIKVNEAFRLGEATLDLITHDGFMISMSMPETPNLNSQQRSYRDHSLFKKAAKQAAISNLTTDGEENDMPYEPYATENDADESAVLEVDEQPRRLTAEEILQDLGLTATDLNLPSFEFVDLQSQSSSAKRDYHGQRPKGPREQRSFSRHPEENRENRDSNQGQNKYRNKDNYRGKNNNYGERDRPPRNKERFQTDNGGRPFKPKYAGSGSGGKRDFNRFNRDASMNNSHKMADRGQPMSESGSRNPSLWQRLVGIFKD